MDFNKLADQILGSPMDAIDKTQRLRRIKAAYDDVAWLLALYPIDQHTGIYIHLSAAETILKTAVEAAEREVNNVL